MRWYLHGLLQYANFHGRASRREFWQFSLSAFFLEWAAFCIPRIGILVWYLLTLLTATPYLALCTRRLHDTGRSAWLLAKAGSLGAAQLAFWMGVRLSHGDALTWAAALTASLAYTLILLTLLIFYCQPPTGPNIYGPHAPRQPFERVSSPGSK